MPEDHIPEHTFYSETTPGRPVNTLKQDLLQKVVDVDLSDWTFPEAKPGITPLFETLETYTLDRGLAKDRKYTTPEGEVLEANGVEMFNRAAFIHVTMNRMKQEGFNGSFYLMDIARLRDADMAIDDEGNKAADYMLNAVSQSLQDQISSLREQTGATIEVCRYGGDEFMFLVDGVDQAQRAAITASLKQATERVKGYYLQYHEAPRDGLHRIAEGQVGIKMMNHIDIPTDETENAIFQYYLRKGLILEKVDIEKIKQGKSEDLQQIQQAAERSIYPDGYLPENAKSDDINRAKMAYILHQHPEMWSSFALAAQGGKEAALIDFVENVMYDRMLNEVVLGFTDMEQHIMAGAYKELVMFDLKFIKEINDEMSVVEGDKAIIRLWSEIQTILGKSPDYQVYRRGGTFAIAFSEGHTEIKAQLRQLQERNLRWNGTSIPVGYTEWNLDEVNKSLINPTEEDKKNGIKEYFRPVLRDLNDNWQSKIGDYIYEHQEVNPDRRIDNRYLNIDKLIDLYYSGPKRGVERNQAAIVYYHYQNTLTDDKDQIEKNNALIMYHNSRMRDSMSRRQSQMM